MSSSSPSTSASSIDAVSSGSPWTRSLTSHTWRIDLQHSHSGEPQRTSAPVQEPLAILQLKLSAAAAEAEGQPTETAVTMAMDRATVQRALAQLDDLDRVLQAKAGGGAGG